jgi:hypothetical protein
MLTECAALKRGQLDDSGVGPIIKRMKARLHLKPKDNIQANKYGVVVPFTRVAMDITGRPHWSKVDCNVPGVFSGLAALRREHCDMTSQFQ